MQAFIDNWLHAEAWVTRNQCGYFPLWFVVLYVIANVAIWLAYESIPTLLVALSRQGYHVFDAKTSLWFMRFIKLCGRGHLLGNVVVFVWPHYFVFGAWHLATAVVSVFTAHRLTKVKDDMLTNDERNALADMLEALNELDVNVHDEVGRLKASAERLNDPHIRERLRRDVTGRN